MDIVTSDARYNTMHVRHAFVSQESSERRNSCVWDASKFEHNFALLTISRSWMHSHSLTLMQAEYVAFSMLSKL